VKKLMQLYANKNNEEKNLNKKISKLIKKERNKKATNDILKLNTDYENLRKYLIMMESK